MMIASPRSPQTPDASTPLPRAGVSVNAGSLGLLGRQGWSTGRAASWLVFFEEPHDLVPLRRVE
jgi:hypothetical protein